MPIASLNVKAPRLAASESSAFVSARRGIAHAGLALPCSCEVLSGSLMTLGADITSSSSALTGTRAVLALSRLGAGRDDRELLLTDRADSLDSTRQRAVLAHDMEFVSEHLSGAPAVAPVATRHEVADVVVPAVVIEMVDTQITAPDSAMTNSPRHLLIAPVARVSSRSDGVVEHHAVLGHQTVGSSQRMGRSMDVLVPGARHSEEWYQ